MRWNAMNAINQYIWNLAEKYNTACAAGHLITQRHLETEIKGAANAANAAGYATIIYSPITTNEIAAIYTIDKETTEILLRKTTPFKHTFYRCYKFRKSFERGSDHIKQTF